MWVTHRQMQMKTKLKVTEMSQHNSDSIKQPYNEWSHKTHKAPLKELRRERSKNILSKFGYGDFTWHNGLISSLKRDGKNKTKQNPWWNKGRFKFLFLSYHPLLPDRILSLSWREPCQRVGIKTSKTWCRLPGGWWSRTPSRHKGKPHKHSPSSWWIQGWFQGRGLSELHIREQYNSQQE